MSKTILGGWQVAQLKEIGSGNEMPDLAALSFIKSNVPQSVHYDLIAAGLLPNVYAAIDNAREAKWVSRADWVYKTEFAMDAEAIAADVAEITFGCVDTFADVFVNGAYLGSMDNMFRAWPFRIPAELRKSVNQLVVHVKGHRRMVADKADMNVERIGCRDSEDWSRERTLVRRYQRSYNTDFLGGDTHLQGIGILRDVTFEAYQLPKIDDLSFAVFTASEQEAEIEISVRAEGVENGKLVCKLERGEQVYTFEGTLEAGKAAIRTTIEKPVLWWPLGDGEQALYQLTVLVQLPDGRECTAGRKVGIRSAGLRLQGKKKDYDFQFIINGREIYARGANWIPLDMLNAGGKREECEKLLKLCVHANMNMLRLWGGGMEEEEWFYNRCDELGIMIWQDGHMHSHTYPDYDDEFLKVMYEETGRMVSHLRSHPCFVIFCGGNEQEEGWDSWNWPVQHDRFYGEKIIYEVLPAVAKEFCPEIPYIPNSPYGKKSCQSPVDGDTHTWGNFYNATEDPLFVTETCWYDGTLSRAETLEELGVCKADEYTGLRWHHRFEARTGHKLHQVNQYTEYHKSKDLREYLQGLEIEQMRADYTALYYLRMRSPSCRGILYWPLNKGGPMMNYGCIDYHGRLLMPYYNLVRLFKNTVIHAYRDSSDICVMASNCGAALEGVLKLTHRVSDGTVLRTEEIPVKIAHGESMRIARLDNWYEEIGNRWREFITVDLIVDGVEISTDTVYFCPFSEVEIDEGNIEAKCEKENGKVKLTITNSAFSKLMMIESNRKIVCTDNYFSMKPGETRTIEIECLEEDTGDLTLTVQSLDCKQIVTLQA